MDDNHRKEQFSLAHIQAIAAAAGCQICRSEVDAKSVDLTIRVLTAALSGDETAQLVEDDSAGFRGEDGDGGPVNMKRAPWWHDAQAMVGELSYWWSGGGTSAKVSRNQRTASARWRLARMPRTSST